MTFLTIMLFIIGITIFSGSLVFQFKIKSNFVMHLFLWNFFSCFLFPLSVIFTHIKWEARIKGYQQIQQTINKARKSKNNSELYAIQMKAADINNKLGTIKYYANMPIISAWYPEKLRKFKYIK